MVYDDLFHYNPNTIIEHDASIPIHYIFSFTSEAEEIDKQWGFNKKTFLSSFTLIEEIGNITFRPNILEIISFSGKTDSVDLPVQK